MLVSAFATFLPKVIEQQFSLTTSKAAILMGVVTIPGAAGGTFFGGYIVKRYNLKCAQIIKFCISCAAISIGLTMAFLISCPNMNFAGVTNSYPNENKPHLSIDSNCNANCSCSVYSYDPICGSNNQMFYSPCHAGCRDVYLFDDLKVYNNCECLTGLSEDSKMKRFPILINDREINVDAIRQKCESDCQLLPVFLVLISFTMLFTFLISMPSLTATLRYVNLINSLKPYEY
jgi:organic anion transporter 4A